MRGSQLDGLRALATRRLTDPALLRAFLTDLDRLEKVRNPRDRAVALARMLVEMRESFRDDERQDDVIAFIQFALRRPQQLSNPDRDEALAAVSELDGPEDAAELEAGASPDEAFAGNVNLYPLAIENTSWFEIAEELDGPPTPVLEIRFTGLRGLGRLLFRQFESATGLTLIHLDGDVIP